MGTSRCCTWTTSTSGMVGALAVPEPPEQQAVPSANTRETITARVVTFDIVFSPLGVDSGPEAPPARHPSVLCRIAAKKTSRDRMVFSYHWRLIWKYHYRGNRPTRDLLRRRKANAAIATSNECNFSVKPPPSKRRA